MEKKRQSSGKGDLLPSNGRILPRATDFEEAVLGALMLEKNAWTVIEGILKQESFYHESNGIIFGAIAGLHNASKPVDLLTVTEYLRQHGELEAAGGVSRLAKLSTNVTGSSHIEHHARIIAQKYLARQLIANRLLLEDDRISAYNLSTGQMSQQEWEAVDRRAGEIWNLKIHISSDTEIRYLDAICSEARRLKRKGKLDMLIIDYLGLIILRNQKFERRQLEIAWITGTLKSLAKELDIPVMLLSQLNRPEKGISIRELQLHDLRESGDIEQDADIVLFLHWPSYYDANKYPEWKEKGKIIIGKYREGARNRSVVFCHDRNFKKIWGNEAPDIKIPGNFKPVDYSEPRTNDDLPF
jgi:replicative DNA helicase